jgi:hypothetical protein
MAAPADLPATLTLIQAL